MANVEEIRRLRQEFGERIRATTPALTQRAQETIADPPEVTGETAARVGFPTLGAIGGGLLGGPAGAIIGAGIGGMGAEGIFGEGETPEEIVGNLTKAFAIEGGIQGAGGGIVRAGRAVVRGATGATGKARQIAREAREKFGINLAPISVGRANLPTFFNRVVARFPFFGGPLRKGLQRTLTEVKSSANRLLFRMGPSIRMAEAGVNLNVAATKRFKVFRDTMNTRYTRIKDAMRAQNATLSTAPIEDSLLAARQELARSRVRGIKGPEHPMEGFIGRWLKKGKETSIVPGVERGGAPVTRTTEVRLMPERFNIDQLDGPRGFLKDLDETMALSKRDGFDVTNLMRIQKVAHKALTETLDNPGLAADLNRTDQFFEKMMRTVFETPTAARFARVTKRGFEVGIKRAGVLNADELAEIIFRGPGAKGGLASSAERVKDIRKLVRPDAMKGAVRAHMTEAFAASRKAGLASKDGNKVFDTDLLRQRLGLDDPLSNRFLALDEALKGTGVTAKRLNSFIDIMDEAFRNAPSNVNDFIARRATLGGGRSLIKAFVPLASAGVVGGGAAGGLVGSGVGLSTIVASTMLIRKIGRVMADPQMMNLARVTFKEGGRARLKFATALRLIDKLLDDEGGISAALKGPSDDREVQEIRQELIQLSQ